MTIYAVSLYILVGWFIFVIIGLAWELKIIYRVLLGILWPVTICLYAVWFIIRITKESINGS
jgi:hypothetical protein